MHLGPAGPPSGHFYWRIFTFLLSMLNSISITDFSKPLPERPILSASFEKEIHFSLGPCLLAAKNVLLSTFTACLHVYNTGNAIDLCKSAKYLHSLKWWTKSRTPFESSQCLKELFLSKLNRERQTQKHFVGSDWTETYRRSKSRYLIFHSNYFEKRLKTDGTEQFQLSFIWLWEFRSWT